MTNLPCANLHRYKGDMRDEAATPGGLNEQSVRYLTDSAHFDLHVDSLTQIVARLNGKK